MPAIVGLVHVISIQSSSILNIGDVYQIAPIATAKTFAGAGSFNTGERLDVVNHTSSTNTFDRDVADQNISQNA